MNNSINEIQERILNLEKDVETYRDMIVKLYKILGDSGIIIDSLCCQKCDKVDFILNKNTNHRKSKPLICNDCYLNQCWHVLRIDEKLEPIYCQNKPVKYTYSSEYPICKFH